jgi:hypothetical protein
MMAEWIILPRALYRDRREPDGVSTPQEIRRSTPAILALPLDHAAGDVPNYAEGVMEDWCDFGDRFGYFNEFNGTPAAKPPEFLVDPTCGQRIGLDFDGESATNFILGARRDRGLDIDFRGKVVAFGIRGLTTSGSGGNPNIYVDVRSPEFATSGALFGVVQDTSAVMRVENGSTPLVNHVLPGSSGFDRMYWFRFLHHAEEGRIYMQYATGNCVPWINLADMTITEARIERMQLRVAYTVPVGRTVTAPGYVTQVFMTDFSPEMLGPEP